MSLQRVLEKWEDYDNRKLKSGDSRYFACTETWEVDYLVSKIIQVYTYLTREKIKMAIGHCCAVNKAPHPRKQFVECVLRRLELAV
jgi:hypothetical protein